MKKFMFLSLVLAVFAISCGVDEPGVDTTRPDVVIPEIGGDNAEITTALNVFYKKNNNELADQWAGDKSDLVVEPSQFHNKILLGVVGNNQDSDPSVQDTFIALFIGADNNIGYATSGDAKDAITKAVAKKDSFLTSWDPRKAIYKDANRAKIAWLSRVAGPNGPNGSFSPIEVFDNGELGVNKELSGGKLASKAVYAIIPFVTGVDGTTATPRPGQAAIIGRSTITSFVYEGVTAAGDADATGNPAGGVSGQRRAWAWVGNGAVQGTEYDARYHFVVISTEGTLFGYAPSGAGQSKTAFPFTGSGAPQIILSDASADKTINNTSPLGKQIIFRQSEGHDINNANTRIIMLTTVVADAAYINKTDAEVGEAKTKQKVVLLEFPAFSALDAIYDGYGNATDFPGYKNVFGTATEAAPPAISPDFGKGDVNGVSLVNPTYETMKVPFLLLDTEVK